MRPQMRIERVAHRVGSPVARQIDMRDLPERVHAGIGAAGALHQRPSRRVSAATAAVSTPCTVGLIGLDLPAAERRCRHIRW